MSDLIYLLLLQNLIFFIGLRGRRSQESTSLDYLLLAFFFGLLYSLGQKFSIFCSLLFFLVHRFFSAINKLTFVFQDAWSQKALTLECFGPTFHTFFVSGLSHNMLVDIIFFREREKFAYSACSLGPKEMRHCNISATRNIFLSF